MINADAKRDIQELNNIKKYAVRKVCELHAREYETKANSTAELVGIEDDLRALIKKINAYTADIRENNKGE